MINYRNIEQVHVELTAKCQASCPMCARNIHGGVDNPNLVITEIDFELFKKIFHKQFLLQLKAISFCGNFGDPILSNHLLDICNYIKTNSNCSIDIYTNASARTTNWWRDLHSVLPKKHKVYFAIDGLEDTHSIYRIGTSFAKIIDNAYAFINAGGNAIWTALLFKHNQHQIEQMKQMAKDMKFSRFMYKASKRFVDGPLFHVNNKNGEFLYNLEISDNADNVFLDKEKIKNYSHWVNSAEIHCMAQHKKELYIDAKGHLWPCCFLSSGDYVHVSPDSIIFEPYLEEKARIKRFINHLGGWSAIDLSQHTVQDIVDGDQWQSAWNIFWGKDRLATCANNCGKWSEKLVSQLSDQIIESKQL